MTENFQQIEPLFRWQGEIASLVSAFLWAGSTCIYRHYGAGLRSDSLNLYKNLIASGYMLAAALILWEPWPRDPATWWLLGISGVVGLGIGDLGFFGALKRLGAQLTSALYCLTPPLTALAAVFYLGERLTPIEITGMAVTLAAVAGVVIYGNRGTANHLNLSRRSVMIGLGYMTFAAVLTAVSMVIARKGLQDSHVLHGTLMRIVPAVAVLLVLGRVREAIQKRPFERPDRRQFRALAVAAFFGTFIGLVLFSAGVKYTKAGVSMSLSATYPIWVIPVARVFLKERTSWQSLVFTLIAVGGVALMFLKPGGAD